MKVSNPKGQSQVQQSNAGSDTASNGTNVGLVCLTALCFVGMYFCRRGGERREVTPENQLPGRTSYQSSAPVYQETTHDPIFRNALRRGEPWALRELDRLEGRE